MACRKPTSKASIQRQIGLNRSYINEGRGGLIRTDRARKLPPADVELERENEKEGQNFKSDIYGYFLNSERT